MDSTESTPLLARPYSQLPHVASVVRLLREQGLDSLSKDDILAFCPTNSGLHPAEETAFVLIVLLQLRLELRVPPVLGLWDKWNQEQKIQSNIDRLDTEVSTVWSEFVENWCTDNALVSIILMKNFHFDDTHERSVTRMLLQPHSCFVLANDSNEANSARITPY
jgi:hypothetical protein